MESMSIHNLGCLCIYSHKPDSFVLFNRQPSLHKMSMMSHRVRLMPYSSKLIHECNNYCY